MFWSYWLARARKGDQHCATLMLSTLATAVARDRLTDAQRLFLAQSLQKIAEANPGRRAAIAKENLFFSRRAGRATECQVEDERLVRAQAVWDEVGDVSGRKLDEGLEKVARRLGIGKAGNHAPDLRALKVAYFEYRDLFREIEQARCDSDEELRLLSRELPRNVFKFPVY